MTARRLMVGALVACGLVVLAWCRPGGKQVQAQSADPVCESTAECGSGTHDDAAYRYRHCQSRHWRNVVIGVK